MGVEDILRWIAAAQTLLERYPVLKTTNSLTEGVLGDRGAFSFILSVLKMLGITEEEILSWLCGLLADESGKGFLTAMEAAIKTVIMTTVTDMYTCSFDPIIQDDMLYKYPNSLGDDMVQGQGVKISVASLDLMNTLKYSPKSLKGSLYYFDSEKLKANNLESYYSRDFDAYLWYVINNGTITSPELARKCTWDNRNKFKDPDGENDYGEKYLSFYNGTSEFLPLKEYLICKYNEDDDTITAYISDRYAGKPKALDANRTYYHINKTIFQFNYDFIWSLKLFDAQTLVSRIMTSVLTNLAYSDSVAFNLSLDLERSLIEDKITYLIQKIIENEEITTIDDSFYTFSNETYESMLNTTVDNQITIQNETGVTISDVKNIFNGVSEEATLQENITTLETNFLSIIEEIVDGVAEDGSMKWNIKANIIWSFIKELIIQLTLESLLSPKIMMIYALNNNVLLQMALESGENTEEAIKDVFKNFDWNVFVKQFGNILIKLIKNIIVLIEEELFRLIQDALSALFKLLIEKMLLEKLRDYKELLANLLYLANLSWGQLRAPTGRLAIDNVQYADIIPEKIEP